VELFLKRHGITGVAEVAGAEDGRGKVAKVEALIARFPGQASYWFVGDTAGDMREARLAGAAPLGVAWGWHGREQLVAAGAERIAETPADLLAIVAPELAADFLGTG
jgi:phosphoglycolate phosphatase